MTKKPINSRAKGARGEREAAKYLNSLGFEVERNARNGIETTDLHAPGLDIVIEVKYGYAAMDIGTKLLDDACEQARGYAEDTGQYWCVLWKPPRKQWRITYFAGFGNTTICGDASIKCFLMNYRKEGEKR